MTSDLRIINATNVAASSRLSLTSTALLLLKIGRKKNKSRIINNKKKEKTMDKKIDMAMSLNELPFIFDRENTTRILNENKIYTVEDLISCTESELVEMGINRLTIDYLKSTLAASYLYFRKENDLPQNLESANLTPDLWERRRYEVAKEVLIKILGTSSYSDMHGGLNVEINKSIDIATTFIKKLKVISESEMRDGDWK